jgi:hypothetical protein
LEEFFIKLSLKTDVHCSGLRDTEGAGTSKDAAATSPERSHALGKGWFLMNFSSKLDTLEQHVTQTKTDAEAAAKESRDKVQQRIDRAQADVNNEVKEAKASAHGKWAQMKADHHARMQDLRTRIEQGNAQFDATAAAANADWAESDAADAIDFAAWAIDNARVSLLYAISTRVDADERVAAARA